MPNWCTNQLTIKGKDTPAVLAALNGTYSVVDFNKITPYPNEYRRLDRQAREYERAHPGDRIGRPKDGFNSGGYEWRIEHWGTKWNADDAEIISADDVGATILFFTAWAPPIPIITRISEMFPNAAITMEFAEPLGGYRGTLVASAGKVTIVDYDAKWDPFEDADKE